MPSLAESRGQVQEALRNVDGVLDHDAILSSLQDEIDKHNDVKEELRKNMREHRRATDEVSKSRSSRQPMRFRFKSGKSDPRKRSHHSQDHEHRKKRRHDANNADETTTKHRTEEETAHPFPREPAQTDQPRLNSTQAFRESLFDALADDEGAHYWEGVYSQPLHVYSRPTVLSAKGALEQMNDEDYASYVQTKMWERKNPHIVRERERVGREQKRVEEEQTRRREEFVRRKEQAAWQQAQQDRVKGNPDEGSEKVFTGEINNLASSERETVREEYAAAWSAYLLAWEKLKRALLAAHDLVVDDPTKRSSNRIPWPVLPSKAILRPNITAFMRNIPVRGKDRLHALKQERVRWHPDKIQQRFAGQVDEGTMKLVTGIFQVVDDLVEEERKKA
nr:hypothetical protein CFP56_24638 [Quercus suber]